MPESIKNNINNGLIKKRKMLFISTKLLLSKINNDFN